MAKVYPSSSSIAAIPSVPSSCHLSSEKEVFTLWMKSLVLHSNGCTVYNSYGQIIFRVDNYDCKCSRKVYLMDSGGKALFKILKKKLVSGRWEGYRWNGQHQEPKPWFKVKQSRIFRCDDASCEFFSDSGHIICYKLQGSAKKSSYKIVDNSCGLVVAEVKRKQTSSGVLLGDDVFSLVVEPNVDHELIMGLVVVSGLMNHSM
ncbi:protein LURP-one-related 11-like [Typha angustifolia]|uniref:protein LURP-one-related 11-like n=1 Tax=Typha angustifolia TaxID=59011 RepID=UPI003C2AD42F